ncbi:hypothetical protein II906_10560 [bacterium]|nr:hypothetical protein [bacterium]
MREFIFTKNPDEQAEEFKKFLGNLEDLKTMTVVIKINAKDLDDFYETSIGDIMRELSDNDIYIDFDFDAPIENTNNNIVVKIRERSKEDDKYIKLQKATDRAFEILKDVTLFNKLRGEKYKEIKEICELYKKEDSTYCWRCDLYEKLIKEPKFAKFTEEQKIILAMQMGALDTHELL